MEWESKAILKIIDMYIILFLLKYGTKRSRHISLIIFIEGTIMHGWLNKMPLSSNNCLAAYAGKNKVDKTNRILKLHELHSYYKWNSMPVAQFSKKSVGYDCV